MRYVPRFHLQAIFCALAVLVCELISQPFTTMSVCDDGLYILMAQTLARTGHIAYNGWAASMMVSQLYLAVVFIKLFGFSFTTVRMSTLLIAGLIAWVVQRTLVHTGVSERNATISTLALVLSPLYLMLSATFMSDISGLFAIVLCLYSCIRALQASTDRSAIAWLCFAVVTNAICGTSRQIAWLGVLVMVPSTLWLLRFRRRVLLAGAAAAFAGALFILACMHWLKLQPYVFPVPLLVRHFPIREALRQLSYILLGIPFLLLPIVALFLPEIRKSRPRSIFILSAALLGYLLIAIHTRDHYPLFLLEPTAGGPGSWVGVHGIFEGYTVYGTPPLFLDLKAQILLTVLSLGGALGVVAVIFQTGGRLPPERAPADVSWKQLGVLLLPFELAYTLLLIAAIGTTHTIYDRYALGLLAPVLICLVRLYQERVQCNLPLASALLVGAMAVYGIAVTHNTFALNRARVALADELQANGIPDTSIDGGWDYNFDVELRHANHINNPWIINPPDAYVPALPLPPGKCQMFRHDMTPHIHPLYRVSFDSRACYGPAPFAPVHYSRWLSRTPGTLYVVRFTTPAAP
jgi:hypothetical protein